MENVNYLSVVPQTFDERVAMYMKSKKEDLAKMLAESAKYTNPDGCAELKDKQSECKGTTYTYASLDLKDEKEDRWEESYDTSIEYTQKRHARIKLWEDVCNEYLEAFCEKHEYEYEPKYAWVADDPGTVANIGDLFVGMDDIRFDIDNNVPESYFEKWYWKNLEVYELTGVHYMNYPSYCKGSPDNWSEERLQRARDAQKRLDEAKKSFQEEMDRIKNDSNF